MPSNGLYRPASHDLHESLGAPSPSSLYLPTGHFAHSFEDVASAKYPVSQLTHVEAAVCETPALDLPALHSMQLAEPAVC